MCAKNSKTFAKLSFWVENSQQKKWRHVERLSCVLLMPRKENFFTLLFAARTFCAMTQQRDDKKKLIHEVCFAEYQQATFKWAFDGENFR